MGEADREKMNAVKEEEVGREKGRKKRKRKGEREGRQIEKSHYMVGSESNEESIERGKGREEEDRERKVITWLEVKTIKKEEKRKGERGERRKTK